MRKPRDYDLELQTLTERARTLKARKVRQLGELVIATGADSVGLETLAGMLIAAMESKDLAAKEGWKRRGGRRRGQRAFERDQTPEPLSDDVAYDAIDSMVMPGREESL